MKSRPSPAFFNLYAHDFARVSVATPHCRVADPAYNATQIIALAQTAAARGVVLTAFPELCISAYSCEDLFHQSSLLDGCLVALDAIVMASQSLPQALIVGMPLRVEHQLFNCAVVISHGKIHGIVPKSYLPNYGEFYEARQFSAGDQTAASHVELNGQLVPFGSALLFEAENMPLFRFHAEICEDVWVPVPPSTFAALAGATVLVNLSASNVVVGKADYRRQLVSQQSARCLSAYLYTSAGQGESTNDMAWDGQLLICENGEMLAESERFLDAEQILYADIDLEKLSRERMRQTSFGQSVRRHEAEVMAFRTQTVRVSIPAQLHFPLQRVVSRFPYVPAQTAQLDARCAEVYHIQVQALVQRLHQSKIKKVVIGISGGLDSTHALLVCVKAMEKLGLPKSSILACTMPGFATSDRTLAQARQLMTVCGCTATEIDIRPSCLQMLKDIGHPFAEGEAVHDITFENVQAGERTSHLFRLANRHGAIVIGTGDLSELALGWCTYGVGDHMSHYNLNAGVPKTLISHLVRWVAESGAMPDLGEAGRQVCHDVVDTDISPELIPGKVDGQPEQRSEQTIGPYELQDFHLYYTLRFGYSPSKIAFLAHSAWHDRNRGSWPDGENPRSDILRNQYTIAQIKKYLGIFLDRFFRTSQFKRTCVPNSPKVGSGGSLSPRGDWRAPSDAESRIWLDNLATVPDIE